MTPTDQALKTTQALLTGSAGRLEESFDIQAQREEWQLHHGRSLVDQWHAVVEGTGRVRYVKESATFGQSSWQRPEGVDIVATFHRNPGACLVSDALRKLQTQLILSYQVETAEMVEVSLQAAASHYAADTIRSLSAKRLNAAWGENWGRLGRAPMRFLESWAVRQRHAYAVDGLFHAGLGTTLEIIGRLNRRSARRAAEGPLREGLCESPLQLLRQTAVQAAAHGELDVVVRLTLALCEPRVQPILDADTQDDFYTMIYDAAPMMLAGTALAELLIEPESPLEVKQRALLKKRRQRTEEDHVRLSEAVINRVRDVLGGYSAMSQHIRALAIVPRDRREAAIDALVEQRFFYPRVMRETLRTRAAQMTSEDPAELRRSEASPGGGPAGWASAD